MVRTHDKSIFIRLKEADLQDYSGKILQVERIPQTINGWYYCLCEVLPPKVVKEEDELERVTKELKTFVIRSLPRSNTTTTTKLLSQTNRS